MKQLKLRLSDELHAAVKASAERKRLSLNADIQRRLITSLDEDRLRQIIREEIAALREPSHD